MTLLAGIRTTDGFVICADSQEFITKDGFQYRVTRQKLETKECGRFHLAIAGSGVNGDVIDARVEWIQQAVSAKQLATLPALREFIQHEMREFNKAHRNDYSRSDLQMRLLIGTATKEPPGESALWVSHASLLRGVNTYALIGYEDQRYEYAMQNMFRADLTIAQAIFLGIYVMLLAEKTCNTVMRPVSVAVAKGCTIAQQPQATIDALTTRVQLFAAQFDQMFLACPDTGLQNQDFANRMREFVNTVGHLRQEYVAEWVGHAIDTGLDRMIEQWNLVPTGTTIVTVPITPEVDKSLREMHERGAAQLRENSAHLQERERVISNLVTLRGYLEQELSGTSVPLATAGPVLSEVTQAAWMGPFRLNQYEWAMLARVAETIIGSPEEMANHRLHLATVALRIAVINQALAVLEAQRPSTPQTLEDQQ